MKSHHVAEATKTLCDVRRRKAFDEIRKGPKVQNEAAPGSQIDAEISGGGKSKITTAAIQNQGKATWTFCRPS